jgi:hypothetical protein
MFGVRRLRGGIEHRTSNAEHRTGSERTKHNTNMKTEKTIWARMCERVARTFLRRRGTELAVKPPPDIEGTNRTLAQLEDSNAVYQALMDRAFAVFEFNMGCALGAADPVVRAQNCDRAAGVLEFVDEVENKRASLRSELARRARAQEKRT